MSHLLAFLQPDETAAQLIARTHVEPVSTGLIFANVLRPGQVLEVCGPAGAGKTESLIQAELTFNPVVAVRTDQTAGKIMLRSMCRLLLRKSSQEIGGESSLGWKVVD